MVRSTDSRQNAMRLTSNVQANAPKDRAMLIFHRLGNNYYLAQIWTPGSAEGREILKSKAERAAEQELAKNPSRGELAQNVETVTIYAAIQ